EGARLKPARLLRDPERWPLWWGHRRCGLARYQRSGVRERLQHPGLSRHDRDGAYRQRHRRAPKMIALILVSALYVVSQSKYLLPNPIVTPGKTVTISKGDLCTRKWGLDRRYVSQAMKEEVCGRYGVKNCPGPAWELDHLIPRELGGADD